MEDDREDSGEEWLTGAWYWIRRADQSLSAYRFYQASPRRSHGLFYVGSQLQTFPFSSVVGIVPTPPTSHHSPGSPDVREQNADNDADRMHE